MESVFDNLGLKTHSCGWMCHPKANFCGGCGQRLKKYCECWECGALEGAEHAVSCKWLAQMKEMYPPMVFQYPETPVKDTAEVRKMIEESMRNSVPQAIRRQEFPVCTCEGARKPVSGEMCMSCKTCGGMRSSYGESPLRAGFQAWQAAQGLKDAAKNQFVGAAECTCKSLLNGHDNGCPMKGDV